MSNSSLNLNFSQEEKEFFSYSIEDSKNQEGVEIPSAELNISPEEREILSSTELSELGNEIETLYPVDLPNLYKKRGTFEQIGLSLSKGLRETTPALAGTALDVSFPSISLPRETPEGWGWGSWKFENVYDYVDMPPELFDNMSLDDKIKIYNQTAEQNIRVRHGEPVAGLGYNLAELLGSFGDPFVALKLARATSGAVYLAADVNFRDYLTGEKPSLAKTLIAGSMGGVIGKLGHVMEKRAQRKQASDFITQAETYINTKVALSKETGDYITPQTAYQNFLKEHNITSQQLSKATEVTGGRKIKVAPSLSPDVNVELAHRYLIGKQKKAFEGSKTSIMQGVDYLLEPISTRLNRVNPQFFRSSQNAERVAMESVRRNYVATSPFITMVSGSPKRGGKLTPEEQVQAHIMLGNASTKKDVAELAEYFYSKGGEEFRDAYLLTNAVLKKDYIDRLSARLVRYGNLKPERAKKLAEDHINVRPSKVVNSIMGKAREAGDGFNYIDGYFPRVIGDLEGAEKKLTPELKKIYEAKLLQRSRELKKKLTKEDRLAVLSELLDTPTASNPSSKSRVVEELTSGNIGSYKNIPDSLEQYFHDSAQELQRYSVFGKHFNKSSMEKSILSLGEEMFSTGKIKQDNIAEFEDILRLRYLYGPRSMDGRLKAIKDLGYASVLAHPANATVQFGDLALGAYINKVQNTAEGFLQAIGLIDDTLGARANAETFGFLNNASHEFTQASVTKKLTDWSFRKSGFSAVDMVGKTSIIKGTINRYKRELSTVKGVSDFNREWGAVFGAEDSVKLINDFKAYKKGLIDEPTSLMKELAFLKVAQVQPVTMLEMPEAWLRHPNGRLLYMLKSFTIKQVDLWRQNIFKEMAQGSKKKAITEAVKLAGLFTTTQYGVENAKQLMLGKDKSQMDLFIISLYKNLGLINKYDVDKIVSGQHSILLPVADLFAPTALEPLVSGTFTSMRMAANVAQGKHPFDGENWKDVSGAVPIIGQLFSAWGWKVGMPPTGSDSSTVRLLKQGYKKLLPETSLSSEDFTKVVLP